MTMRILATPTALALFALSLPGVGGRGVAPAAGQETGGGATVPLLFHTSDRCMACHDHLVAPSGEGVSLGFDWRSSMMGNSARDPYWQASVRRETLDHPEATDFIEDKCTICHLAMARAQSVAQGGQGRAFENFPWNPNPGPLAPLAADGVSCSACHQIQNRNLGREESFTGGFSIDPSTPLGSRTVFGPFEVDAGRASVMNSSSEFHPQLGSHIQSAELCATCHTLYTHALGPDGKEAGELPEQVPYLEWKHSAYAEATPCQSCHMPVVQGETGVSGVLPKPRANVNRHSFRGGNFLMPRMLNRYRNELAVVALPQELDATAGRASENLGARSAVVRVQAADGGNDQLVFNVAVESLVGHKLPSAYPSRRAWLHVTVRDRSGRALFESGAVRPDGSIVGNDNDADGSRFEPHYAEIRGPDQVQIYEDIMVDYTGAVTTGLVWGMDYVKDNRLLPRGFDKASAPEDVAVQGRARDDGDFAGGGDVVRYVVDLGGGQGPFSVVAELFYQPIGFRWARNLGGYDTEESARFTRYFTSMSAAASALLAREEVVVR